ncbi:hypothetical protein CYY_006262 [Polysphondylium violaceum]|uniref:RING-type domain-containing protein n=1 Tax=Polysphondylium violaceum TaxID=133409 RepID=A0A8J4PS62_9MYCE|nr:hypothetical protein CYY_006262 [Polysphondylium violaceum]
MYAHENQTNSTPTSPSASNNGTNASAATAIHFQCFICKNFLTNPKTLRCNHSFCSDCLELSLSRSSKQYHCRVCGDKTNYNEALLNDQLNRFANELKVQVFKSSSGAVNIQQQNGGTSSAITSSNAAVNIFQHQNNLANLSLSSSSPSFNSPSHSSPYLHNSNQSLSPRQHIASHNSHSSSALIPPLPLNPLSSSSPSLSSPLIMSENGNGSNGNTSKYYHSHPHQSPSFKSSFGENGSGSFSPSLFGSSGGFSPSNIPISTSNSSSSSFLLQNNGAFTRPNSTSNSPVIMGSGSFSFPQIEKDNGNLNGVHNGNGNGFNGNNSSSSLSNVYGYNHVIGSPYLSPLLSNSTLIPSLLSSPSSNNQIVNITQNGQNGHHHHNNNHHNNNHQHQHHQVNQHLHNLNNENFINISECPIHCMDIQFYCFDCVQPSCKKCIQSDHNGHVIKSLGEILIEMKEDYQTQKKILNQVKSQALIQNDITNQMVPFITNDIKAQKAAIKKEISALTQQIFEKIDNDFNEYKNSIETKKQKINSLLEEIDKYYSTVVNNIPSSGSNSNGNSPIKNGKDYNGSLSSSSSSCPPSPNVSSSPTLSSLIKSTNNLNLNGQPQSPQKKQPQPNNGNNHHHHQSPPQSNGGNNSNKLIIQQINSIIKGKSSTKQVISQYKDILKLPSKPLLWEVNINEVARSFSPISEVEQSATESIPKELLLHASMKIVKKSNLSFKSKFQFIYAIGGLRQTVERFSIQHNKWNFVSNTVNQRNRISAVFDGRYSIYVFGGESSNNGFEKTVEKYNILEDRWTMIKEMPKERSRYATVFDGDRYIYIIGGKDQCWFSNQMDRFDTYTREYVSCQQMKLARSDLSAVYDPRGYIWAIGGFNGKALDVIEQYDIANDQWINYGKMRRQRDGPGAVFDGKKYIYIMGGSYGLRKISSNLERMNVETWEWETLADMKKPIDVRNSAVFDKNNNQIYVVGGYYTEVLSEVQCYNIDKNEWDFKESMNEPREGNALVYVELEI